MNKNSFPVGQWLPIQTLLDEPDYKGVVVLKARVKVSDMPREYETDPWTGFPDKTNKHGFARWPHPFPPTHFLVLPKLD